MNTQKKPTRLVIEYRALLDEKMLFFYFFDTHELCDSFSFKMTDDNDILDLIDSYKTTLEKYNLKKINNVELVINSFDISFNQIAIKEKAASNKLVNNFLVDTYGSKRESKFIFADSKLPLDQKNSLDTYFTVPTERVLEIRSILKRIGITMCKVFLISEFIAKYFRNQDFNNGLFVIEEENFDLVSIIAKKQIIAIALIEKNVEIKSQLLSIENFVTSFLYKVVVPNKIDLCNVYVTKNTENHYLKSKEAHIIENFVFSDLYSLPISKKVINLSKLKDTNSSEKKKKSSFFSLSLFGKKAFTLIESAVSLTIFAIVSVMVISFVSIYNNNNTDNKRKILTDAYLKSVNTLFQDDPTSEGVIKITDYSDKDLIGTPHFCYLNESMNVDKVSHNPTNMFFKVNFKYDVYEETKANNPFLVQDYTKYVLQILYINLIDGNKTYCDATSFVAVR